MTPLLDDLYGHQVWADAAHLRVIAAHPAAAADRVILERLQHIYTVQRFFLWLTGERAHPFAPPAGHGTSTVEALRRSMREYHEQARRFVSEASEARLAAPIDNPFAPPGAPRLTVAQSLVQCTMHSHYHRGQNAARLRELGAQPPGTDLIAWYWSGRQEPAWD